MLGFDVLIGTLICRRTSYVLDIFLANQKEIQQAYAACRLILATDEPDYVSELKELLNQYNLKGDVITYETVKPDYARNRIWSIACGREAERQYVLSYGAKYLLFLDADMTYDPTVVNVLKAKIQGFNAAYSGYMGKENGSWGFGAGCLFINQETLSRIIFRCYEFKNGTVIGEEDLLDIDLFSNHLRSIKGIFVPIRHYRNRREYLAITPGPVSWFRKVANNLLVRYILIRTSILVKYNIQNSLHVFFSRSFNSWSNNTGVNSK